MVFAFYSAGIVFWFQVAVWWFCHEISIFWGICFPFHSRSFEKAHRTKYIHITMVIVGLVLPALPVIVTFTTGDPSGFGLTRFPTILCTGLQREFYILLPGSPHQHSYGYWDSSARHNILDHSKGMYMTVTL